MSSFIIILEVLWVKIVWDIFWGFGSAFFQKYKHPVSHPANLTSKQQHFTPNRNHRQTFSYCSFTIFSFITFFLFLFFRFTCGFEWMKLMAIALAESEKFILEMESLSIFLILFFSFPFISFAFNLIAIIYCYFRLWMRDVKWNNRGRRKFFLRGSRIRMCIWYGSFFVYLEQEVRGSKTDLSVNSYTCIPPLNYNIPGV